MIAAAGYIYLLLPRWHRKSFRTAPRFPMPTTHEQPDFAHAKSFVLCSFQPTKSACSAAAEKCLSGVGQPLSSVSGRKRYNTLDFPKENRVPTEMLLAPIGNPEPRDFTPLDTPYIFLQNGAQTVKMQFDTIFLPNRPIVSRLWYNVMDDERWQNHMKYQKASCWK